MKELFLSISLALFLLVELPKESCKPTDQMQARGMSARSPV